MTRDHLIAAVQHVADHHGSNGFQQRRRMKPEVAAAIVNAVLDEVLEMARPHLERDWNGSHVIQALREWRSGERPQNRPEASKVGSVSTNCTKNGSSHV